MTLTDIQLRNFHTQIEKHNLYPHRGRAELLEIIFTLLEDIAKYRTALEWYAQYAWSEVEDKGETARKALEDK